MSDSLGRLSADGKRIDRLRVRRVRHAGLGTIDLEGYRERPRDLPASIYRRLDGRPPPVPPPRTLEPPPAQVTVPPRPRPGRTLHECAGCPQADAESGCRLLPGSGGCPDKRYAARRRLERMLSEGRRPPGCPRGG